MSLDRDQSLPALPFNKMTFDFSPICPNKKRRLINNTSLTPIKALSYNQQSKSKTLNEPVNSTRSISHMPNPLSFSQDILSYRSAPSLRKLTVEELKHSRVNSERDLEKLTEIKTYEEVKSMHEKQQKLRNKYKKIFTGKLELRELMTLQAAMESAINTVKLMQTIYTCKGFEYAKKIVSELLHVERVMVSAFDCVIKHSELYERETAQLKELYLDYDHQTQDLKKTSAKLKHAEDMIRMVSKDKQDKVILEVKERNWNVEKVKLEEMVDLMYDKIQELQSDQSRQMIELELTKLKDKLMADIKSYRSENERQARLLEKLQFAYGSTKEELADSRKMMSGSEESTKNLNNELKETKQNLEILQTELNSTREQRNILNEDLRSHLINSAEHYTIKQEFIKLQERNRRLEIKFHMTQLKNLREGDSQVPLDDPIFKIITTHDPEMSIDIEYPHNLYTDNPDTESPTSLSLAISESEIVSSLDLSGFKYPRPNFSAFVVLPERISATYTPPYDCWLETTIRGIFDSKYNEHLMATEETGILPSRFPEFVYSWLGSFMIDELTREITDIPFWKKDFGEEYRKNIMYGLSAERTHKIWELNTFREFLMEELGIDELHFYLHCRFLMFKGPQLGYSQARFNSIQTVTIDQAYELIDIVMTHLPPELVEELKSMLKIKSSLEKGDRIIEHSLVLRLMLEYYRNEKRHKYLAIKRLFARYYKPKAKSKGSKFEMFKYICLGVYEQLSDLKIAKLYRDCWTISKGHINHNTFFTVANENCLFYHMVKLRGLWEKLKVDSTGRIECTLNRYEVSMRDIATEWFEMKKRIEILKQILKGFGVSEIAHNMYRLEYLINTMYQLPLEEYKGLSLGDMVRHYWMLVLKVQIAYFEHNIHKNSLRNKIGGFNSEMELVHFMKGSEKLLDQAVSLQLDKIKFKSGVRKIQRLWKQKAKKKLDSLGVVIKSIPKFKKGLSKKKKK